MTDPLVGTAVAHYEVIAKLGGGGMGVVYTARDVRLGRLVALKFLPPQWSHDESAKQRFLREAQAASATHHRNICTIHDIETAADGQLFIVMAYYEGQTLKQKLEAGPLPIEEAVEIAAQVAEGLAKAHAEGVVHRDIKPGNLMVVEDDVKILDFGLAKFANALQLTMEGSTLGTIAYMSPEQTRGEEADARSDIWAVGVVLHEMLTGWLPFRGAYPEAVSHAIRNDPVPPMRGPGREIPPELTRIIARALAKNPEERFQSARELARDLRLLQGRTIPLDLLTAPINAPALRITASRQWWRSRAALASAALLVVGAVGLSLWMLAPVARVPVVVAPVVNQTGYAELDQYRSALTEELIAELADSDRVRLISYDRLLQILQRFRGPGQDVSSREAMQAITAQSGAEVVIVPTLLYENGAWHARVEFRNADTATNQATFETAPVVSSLIKDTAYGLMPALARGVQAHFVEAGPRRASIADSLRTLVGRTPAPATRMRTLDVAAAFGEGLDAYEQLEYASALRAFTSATQQDPRNPLPAAWQSRVARVMRRDDEAANTADQARRLLSDATRADDRLFVEAVGAESDGDVPRAQARYLELADRHRDDPSWLLELAAFQDRHAMNVEAIGTYRQALALDARLPRPHLELCRMYNRSSEPAKAKEEGQRALTGYRSLGARGGEAQALLCLTDTLRVGSEQDVLDARMSAGAALEIFRTLGSGYNLARAYHYVALTEEAQGNLARAAASWEQSLDAARNVGNTALQSVVLMNLGVSYDALGSRERAVDYFRQGSTLHEALGNEQEAARSQANAGRILIEFGGNPEQGLRDVQNALGVFQKLGDKNFEVFAAQITALYHRNAGQQADAERDLNRALALARERDLDDEILSSTLGLALSRFDRNEYTAARGLIEGAVGERTDRDSVEARIYLGRIDTRLGNFDAAQKTLGWAESQVNQRGDTGLLPLLYLSIGELAYQTARYADARRHFAKASSLWTDDLPDASSVEARSYLGLLDALQGQTARGRDALRAGLAQAQRMARVALEARCRLHLARVDVLTKQFDEAASLLDQIPPDTPARAIGPELQAQTHFWRSRVFAGRGDSQAALSEATMARSVIESLRASLPEPDRERFASRIDIRLISE